MSEQQGGEQRRLERAPGERYARAGSAEGGPAGTAGGSGDASVRRAVLAAVVVADACALLFLVLAQIDLGMGMLAIAAFGGWATSLALVWWGREAIRVRSTRVAAAAAIAGSSIVLALVIDWAWSLAQGGVLGPLEYVLQRFGAVGPLAVATAALVAAVRAR